MNGISVVVSRRRVHRQRGNAGSERGVRQGRDRRRPLL